MSDFTHFNPNVKREDVIKEILYHLQIAKRITDVQEDCVFGDEYLAIKNFYEKMEKCLVEKKIGLKNRI